MAFFEFPHTRTYDSDLGWIIKRINEQQIQMDGQAIRMDELNAWMEENEPRIEHIEEMYYLFEHGQLPDAVVDALDAWLTQYGVLAQANAYTDGEISTLRGLLTNEETARAAEDALINARLDNLIIPGAPAPSAAEVQDARVGYDGVTYTSLGDAIRTQFTDLDHKTVMKRDALTISDDCNSIPYPGMFYVTNTVAASLGNWPDASHGGRLVQFRSDTSDSVRAQIAFMNNTSDVYYRQSDGVDPNGSWYAWRKVAQDRGGPSYKIHLEQCSVPEATGTWASGWGNYGKTRGTVNRYRVRNTRWINVTWTPKYANERFCVIEYDAAGARIGYTVLPVGTVDTPQTDQITLDANTDAITACTYSSSGIPYADIVIGTVVIGGSLEKIYNPSFGSNIAGTRWYRFGYHAFEKDGTDVYNTGCIMFPPNYDPDGEPVPVIINVHGSSTYLTAASGPNSAYETYYEFLSDCGYAMIDCYGWTNQYPNASGLSNPWAMPSACKAYKSLLQLCLRAFNLDKNNIFVMGKSLGGHIAGYLAASLDIRACGLLAPAIALNFGYNDPKYRETFISDFPLVGVADNDYGWATAAACLTDFKDNYLTWPANKRERFYRANLSRIFGYSPEFLRVIGDSALDKMHYSAERIPRPDSFRAHTAPTKLWVAEDDADINVDFCKAYMWQLRNSGEYGYIRFMPDGTGGHHSVDSDPSAPQTTNVTTPLGVFYATIPTAYYELWQHFEQFKVSVTV